ncbi:MAG: COR domain-containing protein [Chloroflexota bacterium]
MRVKDNVVAATAQQRYISREQFLHICAEAEVTDPNHQSTLLQYLHDLGIVLYFRQLALADIYVLDPHWVTIGVYKIINSPSIQAGLLHESQLDYILNHEAQKLKEYNPAQEKSIRYSPKEQSYILQIMMQFELCYEYGRTYGDNNRQYIVPDLLPKELTPEPTLDEGTPLRFIMEYDYLPTAIIARLMIDMKNDIECLPNGHSQQWRYGMMLCSDVGTRAKVVAYNERKTIEITVQGEERRKREYFAIIRHYIHAINEVFENLDVTEWIPLPEHPDHRVSYTNLLGHERANESTYFNGDLGRRFSVADLLDSVISEEERMEEARKQGLTESYIDKAGSVTIIQGDVNDSYLDSHASVGQQTEQDTQAAQNDQAEATIHALYEKRTALDEQVRALDGLKDKANAKVNRAIEQRKWITIGLTVLVLASLATILSVNDINIIDDIPFFTEIVTLILAPVVSFAVYRSIDTDDALKEHLSQQAYTDHGYFAETHQRLQSELATVTDEINRQRMASST